ncbi:DUF7518 family protein [Halorubrum depositum]|uniref:DUF7518 family protein n=1 Tax=Halorubrum depositum TaxID=2583992 RepID=UPI0011A87A67|nr:bZIP transcription factor [Halorubrum depositum]
MSNRVEDLERQVAELQAAVNGLTEELVEMKERVRQVEDAQEVSVQADAADEEAREAADAAAESSGGERRTHSDDHVEVVERTGSEGAETNANADAEAESDDDMVVPEQEATTPDAEAGGSDAESDDEESDSDIIVA